MSLLLATLQLYFVILLHGCVHLVAMVGFVDNMYVCCMYVCFINSDNYTAE